jgi:hypothetical protein
MAARTVTRIIRCVAFSTIGNTKRLLNCASIVDLFMSRCIRRGVVQSYGKLLDGSVTRHSTRAGTKRDLVVPTSFAPTGGDTTAFDQTLNAVATGAMYKFGQLMPALRHYSVGCTFKRRQRKKQRREAKACVKYWQRKSVANAFTSGNTASQQNKSRRSPTRALSSNEPSIMICTPRTVDLGCRRKLYR